MSMKSGQIHRSPFARRGVSLVDVLFGVVLIGALGVVIYNGQRQPDTTAATTLFDRDASFSQVSERASEAGKSVFVFATADWCGPCQSFKAGTLSDPAVQASLSESAELYYLDVTDQSKMSAEDIQLASQLQVQGIPAYYMVRNGEMISRGSGAIGPQRFRDWVDASTEQP